jgi:hypothetical protein
MTTSNYITFILLGVIGLVFLIDFILNSRKKPLEKSVEKFVEKEGAGKGSSNPLSWILKRKKNISLSLILIPILKVLTHFLLFPTQHQTVIDRIVVNKAVQRRSSEGFPIGEYNYDKIEEIDGMVPLDLGSHFELMFTDKLELFIPITIVFLIVVWFFNDKIKAR